MEVDIRSLAGGVAQGGHGPEFFAGKIAGDRSPVRFGAAEQGFLAAGAGHQHFMGAVPRQNGGGECRRRKVGFTFPGLVDDPVQGFVARGIERCPLYSFISPRPSGI